MNTTITVRKKVTLEELHLCQIAFAHNRLIEYTFTFADDDSDDPSEHPATTCEVRLVTKTRE